jgi:GGDEF domain-containing protein
MDLENQARIKGMCEQYGNEDFIVVLGGGEAEASGLAAETVSVGDPTFAGPLAGVSLGLKAYHMLELKDEIDAAVYEEQIAMMEMVLEVDEIIAEVKNYRG